VAKTIETIETEVGALINLSGELENGHGEVCHTGEIQVAKS
jgi:hypothetical protein